MCLLNSAAAAPANPVALDDRARDNLRFIRETMERAGSFTAVPAGAASPWESRRSARPSSPPGRRLLSAGCLPGSCEAVIAIAIAGWTTYSKARDAGTSLFSGPGRRFVYSFAPPLFVGALLTLLFVRMGIDRRDCAACGCCSTEPAS